MGGAWTNYALRGYDPEDGLINGRWMRDNWGVVRWVQIGPATPLPTQRIAGRNYCGMCEVEIYYKSKHCRRCVRKASEAAKRGEDVAA